MVEPSSNVVFRSLLMLPHDLRSQLVTAAAVAAFTGIASAQAQFRDEVLPVGGGQPSRSAVGDLDNDGDRDIVLLRGASPSPSW